MPVTFKTVVKEANKEEVSTESSVAQKVDQYVCRKEELKMAMEEIKPLQKKIKELENEFYTITDRTPADEVVTIQGFEYVLELGKKAKNVSSIDMDRVIEILGDDKFMKLATIPVGKIRDYLSPEEQEEVLEEELSGKRTIKIEKTLL